MPDHSLISVADAQERLRQVRPPLGRERVALASALGRTVAEPVSAPLPLPPFDRAAMDGYAVRAAEVAEGTVLPIEGRTLAGEPPGRLPPGRAWRIFTGAPIPAGADSVVEQEAVHVVPGGAVFGRPVSVGRNIMHQGHERLAGAAVAAEGDRLTVAHLGLLAGAGMADILVWARPRVAVVEVGSELAPAGAALQPGHIYGVHRVWIPAAVSEWGGHVVSVAHAPDDRAEISRAVDAALERADLVITTGGVSVGEADFLPDILAELATPLFWRVAMHPGRAVAAARRRDRLIVSLSGNPGAAYLSAMVLVAPWWASLHGGRLLGRHSVEPLIGGFPRPTREPRYLAVRRVPGGVAADLPTGADVLTSYVHADGLAIVPAGSPAVPSGTAVPYWETPGVGRISPQWVAPRS